MRMKKPVAALAALALAVSLCAAPVMAADTAGWTDGDAGATPTLTLVTASDNSLYFFAGGTATVSYTHLDVYKRQASTISGPKPPYRRPLSAMAGSVTRSAAPQRRSSSAATAACAGEQR